MPNQSHVHGTDITHREPQDLHGKSVTWCQVLRDTSSSDAQVLQGLQGDQLPQQLHGSRRELQCCAHMEAVTQALDAGRITDAQKHLTAAEQHLGVSSEVTGKLSAQRIFPAYLII